jgi:hypothetical protein
MGKIGNIREIQEISDLNIEIIGGLYSMQTKNSVGRIIIGLFLLFIVTETCVLPNGLAIIGQVDNSIVLPDEMPIEAKTWNFEEWDSYWTTYFYGDNLVELDEKNQNVISVYAKAWLGFCNGSFTANQMNQMILAVHNTPNIHNVQITNEFTNPDDLVSAADIKSKNDLLFKVNSRVAPLAGEIICRVYSYFNYAKQHLERKLRSTSDIANYWDDSVPSRDSFMNPSGPSGSGWIGMSTSDNDNNWYNYWDDSETFWDELGVLSINLFSKLENTRPTYSWEEPEFCWKIVWCTAAWERKGFMDWHWKYYFKVTYVYENRYWTSDSSPSNAYYIEDDYCTVPTVLEGSDGDLIKAKTTGNIYHRIQTDLSDSNIVPKIKVQYRFKPEGTSSYGSWSDGYSYLSTSYNGYGLMTSYFRLPNANQYGTYEIYYLVFNGDNDYSQDYVGTYDTKIYYSTYTSPDRESTSYTGHIELKDLSISITDIQFLPAMFNSPIIDNTNNHATVSKFKQIPGSSPVTQLFYGQDSFYMIRFTIKYPEEYTLTIDQFSLMFYVPYQSGQSWIVSRTAFNPGGTVDANGYKHATVDLSMDGSSTCGFYLKTSHSTLDVVTASPSNVMRSIIWDYFNDNIGYYDFMDYTPTFSTTASIYASIRYNYYDGSWNYNNVMANSEVVTLSVPSGKQNNVNQMRQISQTAHDFHLIAFGAGFGTAMQEQIDNPVETLFELGVDPEDGIELTPNAWEYLGKTISDTVMNGLMYDAIGQMLFEFTYNLMQQNAKDPLDFRYNCLFYPSGYDPAIDPTLGPSNYCDSESREISENLVESQVQLQYYYEALYHTANRLNTARLYGSSTDVTNQVNHYKWLLSLTESEEDNIESSQTALYERDQQIRNTNNVKELLESMTVGQYFNYLNENKNKMFDPDYYAGQDLTSFGVSQELQNNLQLKLNSLSASNPYSSEIMNMNAWQYFQEKYLNNFDYSKSFNYAIDTVYPNPDYPTLQVLTINSIPITSTAYVPRNSYIEVRFSATDTNSIRQLSLSSNFGSVAQNIQWCYNSQYLGSGSSFVVSGSIPNRVLFTVPNSGVQVFKLSVKDSHSTNPRTSSKNFGMIVDDGSAPLIQLTSEPSQRMYDSDNVSDSLQFTVSDSTYAYSTVSLNNLQILQTTGTTFSVNIPNQKGAQSFVVRSYDKVGLQSSYGKNIVIFDDDDTAPSIDFNLTNTMFTDQNVAEMNCQIKVLIKDLMSGFDKIASGISEIVYSIDSGVTTTISLDESPLEYILMISVPNELGSHTIRVQASDSDNEDAFDSRVSEAVLSYQISDDDESIPTIILEGPVTVGVLDTMIEYTVRGSDPSGISHFDFIVSDLDSGLLVFSDVLTVTDSINSEDVSEIYILNLVGTEYSLLETKFTVSVTVTDNDNDRTGDSMTSDPISLIVESDDDYTAPLIGIESTVGGWIVNLSDEDGEIDSEATAIVSLYYDGELISQSNINEGIHNIEVPFRTGSYSILIEATNNDRDFGDLSDEETSTASDQFDLTLAQLYQFVDSQLIELDDYVDENLNWIIEKLLGWNICKIRVKLYNSYMLYTNGCPSRALLLDSISQIFVDIAEHKVSVFNCIGFISDDVASVIESELRVIQSEIIYLMAGIVDTEFTFQVAIVENKINTLVDLIGDKHIPQLHNIEALLAGAKWVTEGLFYTNQSDMILADTIILNVETIINASICEIEYQYAKSRISFSLRNEILYDLNTVRNDLLNLKNFL